MLRYARALTPTLCAVLTVLMPACATDQGRDVEEYRTVSDPPGPLPRHARGEALSLVDALRMTAAHNEQLAAQGERYVQALADRQQAAAALKPTFDIFAETSLLENTGSRGVVQTDLGMSTQYRFLTGLGDSRNIDAAEARARSERWLILDLRETLLLQTARAYYAAILAERLTAVLESSVRAQLDRLDDARARNAVGFARPLDVAQIEAQVSRTRTGLISAESQSREARANLGLLANADVAESVLTDGFDPPADDRPLQDLLAIAQRHRQDIISARNNAAAARALVEAAIGQYAPGITLNLDYFLAQIPDDSAANVAGLIQLRVPLFSAGRIEADIRAAWSVFRERVLDYRLRMREVQRDVETAVLQLGAARARVDELRTQVRVARETLELAEASYQAGLGTNLERTSAQDQLLTAELDATIEEFNTRTGTLTLLRACGLLSGETIQTALPPTSPADMILPDAPLLDRARDGAPLPTFGGRTP